MPSNLTPQQILDILTNLSQSEILQICELLGPCQASATLYDTLTILQTFNNPL